VAFLNDIEHIIIRLLFSFWIWFSKMCQFYRFFLFLVFIINIRLAQGFINWTVYGLSVWDHRLVLVFIT
jgi:hypothetical protein